MREGLKDREGSWRRAGGGHASFHSIMPVKGGGGSSSLAFDLCKAPGVWVCHLKVFSSYTMIPKEEEKETSCHMRRDESCERKTIRRVASPHPPGHPALIVIKNMISHTDSFTLHVQMSSGNAVENILIEYKINFSFSHLNIRKNRVERGG